MKLALDMTLAEIQYLITVHEFISSQEKTLAEYHFSRLRKIVDFIEYRVMNTTVPMSCPCGHCEDIRATSGKIKEPEIKFSLD